MNRREFMARSTAAAVISANATPNALAQDDLDFNSWSTLFGASSIPSFEDFSSAIGNRGDIAPTDEAILLADAEIMAAMPSGLTNAKPIDVAEFLLNLSYGRARDRNGNMRPDWAFFSFAWPTPGPWNPLIVRMFDSVNKQALEARLASGVTDETHWCAAFVNFCIDRANEGKLRRDFLEKTNSPLAIHFRNIGEPENSPRRGDVVVMKNLCNDWSGHVGFYVDETDSAITILGGNQTQKSDALEIDRSPGSLASKVIPADYKWKYSVISDRPNRYSKKLKMDRASANCPSADSRVLALDSYRNIAGFRT